MSDFVVCEYATCGKDAVMHCGLCQSAAGGSGNFCELHHHIDASPSPFPSAYGHHFIRVRGDFVRLIKGAQVCYDCGRPEAEHLIKVENKKEKQGMSVSSELVRMDARINAIANLDSDIEEDEETRKVAHASGATSSHFSPFNFYPTYEGMKKTSQRFLYGNHKHEDDNTVYQEANWLKAYKARDVGFFRDRAGHAIEHIVEEMRGIDDPTPGGNLGAIGWFQDVMAFIQKNDPFLYGAIRGQWRIDDEEKEELMSRTKTTGDEE